MRENMGLYRGKRKIDGKWAEGSYLHLNIGRDFICDGTVWIGTLEPCKVEVIPETVGLCSGVPDKHGKLIFEGDIVRIDDDVKKTFPMVEDGPVRFSRGGFFVGCYGDVLRSFDVIADYAGTFRGEVIGNIHDNPELLEVSK